MNKIFLNQLDAFKNYINAIYKSYANFRYQFD